MGSTFHLSGAWIAASVATIIFVIAYPLIVAAVAHRRLSVRWRYFGYGALIFFLFQLISRVPAVEVIQIAIAPQLKASPTLLWIWLAILVVTAGLFEEVGRYVGYRWLMRREEKIWSKAVMYGLGHGGLESIVLVGGLAILSLIGVVALSSIKLDSLPAAQRIVAAHQLNAIAAQPGWFPLLAAWERLWTIPVHVALSVMVLQVFRRGNIGWLWLAVLAHAVVDGAAVAVPQLIGSSLDTVHTDLIVEGIVAVFGLIALWIIFALRDRPEQAITPKDLAAPEQAVGL
jgi:uncharacterized membrane protein YhfC